MHDLVAQLQQLDPNDTAYASRFVDLLLRGAVSAAASDVHLQPLPDQLDVRWRLDGVLHQVGQFPRGKASDVVARLKVLAGLLTYRGDLPQEGRIRQAAGAHETRVSTFPTIHGERAVIRLLPTTTHFERLARLGLPEDLQTSLPTMLCETSGALVLCGPAGSGKTTTIYACLREIMARDQGARSIVTLEDPVEMVLDGTSQSQIDQAAGFDFASGVRSLMRQDPDVIMIGEVRDRGTAEAAFTASLTGHLVLTTFHAGSCAGAVARLSDLGVEPYLLRSGLRAVISQRLLRRLCSCAVWSDDPARLLGFPVERARDARGCEECWGTGYRGRGVIAEMLDPDVEAVAEAILARRDAAALAKAARAGGMRTLFDRAAEAIRDGWTTPLEARRVLGSIGD